MKYFLKFNYEIFSYIPIIVEVRTDLPEHLQLLIRGVPGWSSVVTVEEVDSIIANVRIISTCIIHDTVTSLLTCQPQYWQQQ